MSATSDAWEAIFTEHNLLEAVNTGGYVDLEPRHFNVGAKEYQIRLLTKMDSSSDVPEIMSNNGLNLLTLSTRSWRLGHFSPFHPLPTWTPPSSSTPTLSLPSWVESVNLNAPLTSEGSVLSALSLGGVLEDCFREEVVGTTGGKARAQSFNFQIFDTRLQQYQAIETSGFQYEVDAAYEGRTALHLAEAKKQLMTDFNVRQIYYPFRAWDMRIKKEVRTYFVNFVNGVFDVMQFSFSSPASISSIELVAHNRFVIGSSKIEHSEIKALAMGALVASNLNHSAIFPQADSVPRIMDLISFLGEGPKSDLEIATQYLFDPRQSKYYFDASAYLGLAEKVIVDGQVFRQLTPLGHALNMKDYKGKVLGLAEQLLRVKPVASIYLDALSVGHVPTKDVVLDSYEAPGLAAYSESTVARRIGTVLSWVRWLVELPQQSI